MGNTTSDRTLVEAPSRAEASNSRGGSDATAELLPVVQEKVLEAEATAERSAGGGSRSSRRSSCVETGLMSEDEFNQITLEPKDYLPLEEDSWGVSIMCIVKDYGDILEGKARTSQVITFIVASLTLVLNITIQLMMLVWIKKYVVSVATHDSQVNYANYKANIFTAQGDFNADSWDSYDGKGPICNCALSKKPFLMTLLFIWGLRILQELRLCQLLFSRIRALHHLPKGAGPGDMVLEKRDSKQQMHFEIIALTPGARAGIYMLIVLPKISIALVLFYSGVVWLVATDSFYALIMNALALEFIMHIDVVCFHAVFPPLVQKAIQRTQIATPKPDVDPTKDKASIFRAYALATVEVICIIILLELYVNYFQTVLPAYGWDVASHCSDYVAFSMSEVCTPGVLCFPFGKQHDISGAPAA